LSPSEGLGDRSASPFLGEETARFLVAGGMELVCERFLGAAATSLCSCGQLRF